MRVDLHIHTTASDGTWTPEELIGEALNKGVDILAVTDHDSVGNVLECKRLALANNLGFLAGVEINSTKAGRNFHVLGYGIDIAHPQLQELMAHNIYLMEQIDIQSIELLEREGWPVSTKEFINYTYDRRRGGWASLAYLIDKQLCSGVNDFFQRIFTKEHALGFPTFPSISQVIKTIHEAGGVAICAHAASGFHGPGLEQVLSLLGEEAFDGYECYHSNHSQEDVKRLLAFCKENNLFITGGSDCHGQFVPGRFLGEPIVELEQISLPILNREF